MDNKELLLTIEKAAENNVELLDLSNKQISLLPPEIGDLSNLRRLELGFNKLTVLPSEIGNLKNLIWLGVRQNQLTELPPEIGNLASLTRFDLRSNHLITLPPEIGKLKNLLGIGFRDNKLSCLPSEIGDLTGLSWFALGNNLLTALPFEIGNLINLTWLDLRGNPLPIPQDVLAFADKPANIINYYLRYAHDTSASDSIKITSTINNDSEVSQIIEQANQSKARSLDLSHKNLTQLPPEIGQLTELTELDLGDNQLTSLPNEIRELKKLKKLRLDGNRLAVFPIVICELANLEVLRVTDNHLAAFPKDICRLTKLVQLRAGGNQITSLPPEISNLKELEGIGMGYNKLTEYPSGVNELTKLKQLSLKSNYFTLLPAEIGNLKELEELYLDNNQLSELPHEIEGITKLKELELRGNPLPILPEIISLVKQPAKIINYYFKYIEQQKRPLNEAKAIIIGQGAVGKTSLVKRLLEDHFDLHETKTDGICIKQWDVISEGAPIRLNIWDFGGQEIMHATHQFFLTKRSLYILVLDSRLDEQENRVEYWLKLIQSFGGNSPVVIVCNKSDEHDLDLNWKGLQEKYPTVKAFCKNVSCKTGQGIERLKILIKEQVSQLEHIHDQLILSWFSVKERLEALEADYLSYHEYQKLCEEEQIMDELSQQTLLGFLHDLGIVLHFDDHPILEETNVLNPEWVTKGVYQILNSYELFQNKGELDKDSLDDILDVQIYPHKKQQFILDMMKQFELCFEFDDVNKKRFLIPDLLSKEEPDTGEWSDSLSFQYHYDILPGSVISRFIVRMQVYISKRTYWRSGVVLVSEDQRNRALVKADIEDKKIFIDVTGNQDSRRTFLEIIRSEFRKIHATIPKIEPKEKVPLPSSPKIVVDYKHLLKLETLGRETYFPEGAFNEINVSQLLDGIEPKSYRIERIEQQGIRFEPKIEINPNIQVNTMATASSDVSISIETKQAMNFLLGSLAELKEEIKEVQPTLSEDIEKIEDSVAKIENAKSKEEVAKSSALPKIKRFLENANDTGTALGKTIKGLKSGVSILQDIAKYYNKIAQWCGMPIVPGVFLKQKKTP